MATGDAPTNFVPQNDSNAVFTTSLGISNEAKLQADKTNTVKQSQTITLPGDVIHAPDINLMGNFAINQDATLNRASQNTTVISNTQMEFTYIVPPNTLVVANSMAIMIKLDNSLLRSFSQKTFFEDGKKSINLPTFYANGEYDGNLFLPADSLAVWFQKIDLALDDTLVSEVTKSEIIEYMSVVWHTDAAIEKLDENIFMNTDYFKLFGNPYWLNRGPSKNGALMMPYLFLSLPFQLFAGPNTLYESQKLTVTIKWAEEAFVPMPIYVFKEHGNDMAVVSADMANKVAIQNSMGTLKDGSCTTSVSAWGDRVGPVSAVSHGVEEQRYTLLSNDLREAKLNTHPSYIKSAARVMDGTYIITHPAVYAPTDKDAGPSVKYTRNIESHLESLLINNPAESGVSQISNRRTTSLIPVNNSTKNTDIVNKIVLQANTVANWEYKADQAGNLLKFDSVHPAVAKADAEAYETLEYRSRVTGAVNAPGVAINTALLSPYAADYIVKESVSNKIRTAHASAKSGFTIQPKECMLMVVQTQYNPTAYQTLLANRANSIAKGQMFVSYPTQRLDLSKTILQHEQAVPLDSSSLVRQCAHRPVVLSDQMGNDKARQDLAHYFITTVGRVQKIDLFSVPMILGNKNIPFGTTVGVAGQFPVAVINNVWRDFSTPYIIQPASSAHNARAISSEQYSYFIEGDTVTDEGKGPKQPYRQLAGASDTEYLGTGLVRIYGSHGMLSGNRDASLKINNQITRARENILPSDGLTVRDKYAMLDILLNHCTMTDHMKTRLRHDKINAFNGQCVTPAMRMSTNLDTALPTSSERKFDFSQYVANIGGVINNTSAVPQVGNTAEIRFGSGLVPTVNHSFSIDASVKLPDNALLDIGYGVMLDITSPADSWFSDGLVNCNLKNGFVHIMPVTPILTTITNGNLLSRTVGTYSHRDNAGAKKDGPTTYYSYIPGMQNPSGFATERQPPSIQMQNHYSTTVADAAAPFAMGHTITAAANSFEKMGSNPLVSSLGTVQVFGLESNTQRVMSGQPTNEQEMASINNNTGNITPYKQKLNTALLINR